MCGHTVNRVSIFFFYAISAAVLVYYAQHDKKGRHDMVTTALVYFLSALVLASVILSAHYLAQIRDILREMQKSQKSPASRQGRY